MNSNAFNTSMFFSGGSGLFVEYFDIIKPVYLYAIFKMLLMKEYHGLPFQIINCFTPPSILEWYINRRYINPLKQLDFRHQLQVNELDNILHNILLKDPSLFKLAPLMNFNRLLHVYRSQHMDIPVYVYSEQNYPFIEEDCKTFFQGIKFTYIYGNIKESIKNCNTNFTYILSNIELLPSIVDALGERYANIVLPDEYRYNYKDNWKNLKIDIDKLKVNNPCIKTSTMKIIDYESLTEGIMQLIGGD